MRKFTSAELVALDRAREGLEAEFGKAAKVAIVIVRPSDPGEDEPCSVIHTNHSFDDTPEVLREGLRHLECLK